MNNSKTIPLNGCSIIRFTGIARSIMDHSTYVSLDHLKSMKMPKIKKAHPRMIQLYFSIIVDEKDIQSKAVKIHNIAIGRLR